MLNKKMIAVLCVVVLGFAGAFHFGYLDWATWRTQARIRAANASSQVRSATQINLSSSPADANAIAGGRACRENMRRIESAKRAAGQKSGISVGTVSRDAVAREIGTFPACPSGGEYALGTLEVNVSCNVSANRTTDPADDHILAKF